MPMITRGVAVTLIGVIEMIGAAKAAGPRECAPILAFKDIRFSEIEPPTLERKWTAIILVDASRCQANSSGYFEIIFTRTSEVAPDLEFRERYAWRSPSVEVAVILRLTKRWSDIGSETLRRVLVGIKRSGWCEAHQGVGSGTTAAAELGSGC